MPSNKKKRKKLTTAQLAARRRSAAARKAAETRRLNALAKARAAKKRKRGRATPRRLTGAQQVKQRATQRREKAAGPGLVSKFIAGKSSKTSATQTALARGGKLFAGLAGKRALLKVLKQEPKPVRNFAKIAIKRGQTPKKAIEQGRILNDAGRLGDNGKLKKSRGMTSENFEHRPLLSRFKRPF